MFDDSTNGRTADIFLDVFHMCHTLQIGKRLTLDDYTITVSDLLMTKLQIVEINDKDVRDIVAILHDHPIANSVAQGDKETIDSNYVASLCASDWGLCTTITLTLKKIPAFMTRYDLEESEKATIQNRIDSLLKAVEDAPKSLKWKVRATIGEKKRWYDLPEDPIRTQQL